MKLLKWLLIVLVALVLIIGIGTVALVYLVDWNDFKETIQNQTKKHTGRDLTITGDLSPSVFPWAGISIGEISLANATGFGDQPFAKIGSADVKVELLPLLRKEVNIRTVELKGLNVDLQRAADGTTNWDDLIKSTSTTTTSTDDSSTEVEVEGGSAAIAALAVGGIEISDANVSWLDVQSGTDAKLSNFSLNTGAIELAKPFNLETKFNVASKSMDLAADIVGRGEVSIDLEKQVYSLTGFTLDTDAKGASLPNGELVAKLAANINANMLDQRVSVEGLSLAALGLQLDGKVDVTELDQELKIIAALKSETFDPKELMAKLGIAAPQTADDTVLSAASLSMNLAASPSSAALNDLTITLDDTTFNGKASVPSLAGAIPPLRFDFTVDAIDLDRYLPPASDAPVDTTTEAAPAADGDAPLGIPNDLIRQLDVDGVFKVNKVKISNLTTESIVVPVTAKNGKVSINNLQAALYQGQINSNVSLDASQDSPRFAVDMNLDGIQADPLLADLLQKNSPLSGKGGFAANLTTSGDSINAIKAGLNGKFNTAFTDGSVNGVNLGYQIRRAQAVITGKELAEDAKEVKTDFSALTVSGNFTNGVMQSDDLDMRSPLLRVGGAGSVDLPQEYIDYTLTTLITGSAQGQGGKDLDALKGVKLDVPIQATFAALAADPAGIILRGMRDNLGNNLKDQAAARAKAAADELKAEAKQKLEAEKAKATEAFNAKKAEAEAELAKQKEAAQQKASEAATKATEDAKDKLKGKLKGLLK